MKKFNLQKSIAKISNIYVVLGFVFIIGALALVATPIMPYIIYRINPGETTNEVEKISQPVANEDDIETEDNIKTLPPLDTTLPETPYVQISQIGVNSPISTASDYTEALKQGTWLVAGYGTPENGISPIILAAHRFGYIYWDDATREKISFFNLPKTHEGDTIDIIWNQRRYSYEIYHEEEGTQITDYSADLILYTCKYFNSPTRIFRYARCVAP